MNALKTGLFLTVLTLLLILLGSYIGGPRGAMVMFVIALGFNFVSYWYSDKIVLTMYRAREIGRDDPSGLYRIVEELADKARLPMPKVYIIPSQQPNAFATGRGPKHAAVACTEGILRTLDRDELEGVIGHELSHVKHRDILIATVAASIAGAISMIAFMARWAAIFGGAGGRDDRGGGGLGLLVMAIIAPIIALIIQMAISRSREYAADEEGARIAGSPLGLMNALRKLEAGASRYRLNAGPATAHLFIVNPLKGKNFTDLFRTHPSTDDRIERLQRMI
jgi:heat shock protein HtpX